MTNLTGVQTGNAWASRVLLSLEFDTQRRAAHALRASPTARSLAASRDHRGSAATVHGLTRAQTEAVPPVSRQSSRVGLPSPSKGHYWPEPSATRHSGRFGQSPVIVRQGVAGLPSPLPLRMPSDL